jgi:hypothetical protein
MRAILVTNRLWETVSGEDEPPPPPEPRAHLSKRQFLQQGGTNARWTAYKDENEDYEKWEGRDAKASNLLRIHISETPLVKIQNEVTSKGI